MFLQQQLDCLILGEEPAGHWLCDKLTEVYQSESLSPRIGWIRLSKRKPQICLSETTAQKYHIESHEPAWYAELVCPEKIIRWAPQAWGESLERPGRLSVLSKKAPQWESYAEAVWKFVGRSHKLNRKGLLEGALSVDKFHWWNPLSHQTEPLVSLEDGKVALQAINLSDPTKITLRFSNQKDIVTKHLIWNSSLQSLTKLTRAFPSLETYLPTPPDCLSEKALYPLRISAHPQSVNLAAPALFFLLDHGSFPHVDEDVWPVQVERFTDKVEVTVWVGGHFPASLDEVSEKNKRALGKLWKLFPFLQQGTIKIDGVLSTSCMSAQQRREKSLELEEVALEQYEHSLLDCRTRHPGFFLLLPALKSHLPYPEGPLSVAQSLIEILIGTPRWKAYENHERLKQAQSLSATLSHRSSS